MEKTQRNILIKKIRKQSNKSFSEIGNLFKISAQRVEQICTTRKKVNQGRDYVRDLVRKRDNHTCQDCKKKWVHGKKKFDVHHLNGFCGKKSRGYDSSKDTRYLVTLCHRCHFNHPEHSRFMPVIHS